MATEASKVRFVKCPKCRRLLVEVRDIHLYECGGCGTILQAKARRASMEIGHDGSPAAVLYEDPPCSNPEKESNRSADQEPSACEEDVDVEAGSPSGIPNSTGLSAVRGEETVSVASAPQSQRDGSWKLGRHGSINSSSSYKMGEPTESVASEEDMFDGVNPGKRQIQSLGTSIARSSHAYDSSVSSGDDISGKHERYWFLSRRTFRNRKLAESSSIGTKDGKEDTSVGDGDSGSPGISDLKQRSSPGDAARRTSLPDAYPDSENLYPLQNKLESDHLSSRSRSPSEDSASLENFPCNGSDGIPSTRLGYRQIDRMELHRRGDLLRDQPTRPFAGGRGGDRRWVPVGGGSYDGHRPLFSNRGSKQEPTPPCDGDVPRWHSGAFGQNGAAQRYPSSRILFFGEGDGSYSHHPRHHPEDYNIPVPLPPSIIHCRACTSPACFHSSSAASSRRQKADRDGAAYDNSETTDHHREEHPHKEKRQHKKRRHCRPVSGGAPFVVCNRCLELLQLPVDFLVSRGRCHKLRCGACSEVLTFLHDGGHVVPDSTAQSDPSSGEPSSAMTETSKHEGSVNQSHDMVQEDPVSYSEEYGPPPSQSYYSTDSEPVPSNQRSSKEHKGEGHYKQTMGPSLHHLMGYASARDLIYVPSDEDERHDSMGMPCFYRTSDDIAFVEGYGGTGARPPHQERSAVGYSPNHSSEIREEEEEEEEEEPVVRLAGARRGPPLNGFVREDTDELINHGLANMKLRRHTNGRRTW